MEKLRLPEGVGEALAAAKQTSRDKYGLKPGNNVDLICKKLAGIDHISGAYVECGVFQGNTLFTVASFLRQRGSRRPLIGMDTFAGFPDPVIDDRDHPRTFETLFREGRISAEHYERARARTKDFSDVSHLKREYFCDVRRVFEIAADFDTVTLVEGDFKVTLPMVQGPIALLFLDCDLYQSYIDCLEALYPRVPPGGVVVFDEYYSLKYPGARLAVDEVFAGKPGSLEGYVGDDGFERWCFVKA